MADLTFFPDSHVDRVLGVVMELAGEVYVLKDRLRTLETLLEQKGTVTRADLDGYQPGEPERAERLAARDALIRRILTPMTYEMECPDPPYEPA